MTGRQAAAVAGVQPASEREDQSRIEHRLFSYITMNWRGKPLVSLETMINLLGATTTTTGREVYACLDDGEYWPRSVSDAELRAVNLHRDEFHPEWNYSIKPRT